MHVRAARLLAAAAMVTPAVLLAAPAAGSPLPTPSPTASQATPVTPVEVRLGTIEPAAPQPGDTLVLTGTVRNVSAQPVSDLAVELLMGGTVGARSSFDAYAAAPTGDVQNQGLSVVRPFTPLANPTLAPARSEPFTIQVPVDNLNLPSNAWQVHELGIAVDGATSLGVGPVGQLRTFLPWAPQSASVGLSRLQLAWLWPLVDRPHRGVTPVWLDDDLARAITPAGRLGRLVSAAQGAEHEGDQARAARRSAQQQLNAARRGKHGHRVTLPPVTTHNVPVTWAIDPMLVDDVSAMRSPYQVAANPKPVAGAGTDAAKRFSGLLRSAVGSSDVLPLPYADPDVTAAVRDNLGTLVGVAATNGRRSLAAALPGSQLLQQTAWPIGGLIDERGVNALYSDDITNFVLSDRALPPRVPPSATPSAHTSLLTTAGPISVVLTDSTLSDAVTAGSAVGGSATVALQRFLAETLMIETEAPGTPDRSIVVAPGRRWSPSASYADALLADTGKVPWLEPVSLQHVVDSPINTSVARAPLTYPASARHDELPASYLAAVSAVNRDTAELANILPTFDPETRPYSTAVLRALSSAWRSNPALRRQQLDVIRRSLATEMAAVHIASAPGSFITLTSHGGKLPVSIANDLNAPVKVTVQLDANQRLTFPDDGRVDVSIPAHQHVSVSIKASAKTSGVFPLHLRLLTPGGKPYGTRVTLFVRSTVYGTITLVITGAATAALLVAVAIRLIRRAIAARRPAAAAP